LHFYAAVLESTVSRQRVNIKKTFLEHFFSKVYASIYIFPHSKTYFSFNHLVWSTIKEPIMIFTYKRLLIFDVYDLSKETFQRTLLNKVAWNASTIINTDSNLTKKYEISSILIKFSVGLSVCLSVCLSFCHSVCLSFCLFHSEDFIFKAICKFFFHLLEQALRSVLVKSEFKYLK